MFFIAEAAPIPTSENTVLTPFLRVTARSDREAREALVSAFTSRGAAERQAFNFANETEGVWTDFGEVGVTARISPSGH